MSTKSSVVAVYDAHSKAEVYWFSLNWAQAQFG
jgi:hypothetical protein